MSAYPLIKNGQSPVYGLPPIISNSMPHGVRALCECVPSRLGLGWRGYFSFRRRKGAPSIARSRRARVCIRALCSCAACGLTRVVGRSRYGIDHGPKVLKWGIKLYVMRRPCDQSPIFAERF
jgi:hypothetical protein